MTKWPCAAPDQALNNAAQWIRDETNAQDEESEAFRDVTICGEGWTEMRKCYEDDPEGKTIQERVDPLEMGVNAGACKSNYTDARLKYRARSLLTGDIKAMFPEYEPEVLDASKWMNLASKPEDGGQGNKLDYPDETPEYVGAAGAGDRKSVV